MSDEPRPFELEPEKETSEPDEAKEAIPEASTEPRAGRPAPTYEERAAERANRRLEQPADGAEVDSRTVAERRGEELVPRGNEEVAAPLDWPAEAFSFPFRPPGGMFLLVGVVVLVLLDLLELTPLAFVGFLLKLLLVAFVLRAQIFVIASSAAGRDRPVGWQRALDFEADDLWPFVRTCLAFVLLFAPGCLVLKFGNPVLGLLLLGVGSMYAGVVALGVALQEPSLKYPWRAFAWMGAHPVPCLVGSLGWWLFVLTEASLQSVSDQGPLLFGFLSIVLRGACFYGLLVSARFLGVMGRTWLAGGTRPEDAPPKDGPLKDGPEDDSA